MNEEIKQLIARAKNICLIPNEHEPESISSALALFYTLKELGKNVNLILENIPEKLNFLTPSLDFISQPKNFVISIPRSLANVSQIYYEKNEESLKIHLTIDKGQIKKENVSFYFSDVRPDLILTLGIQNFKKHLENTLDSFGFLLGAPLINIDNNLTNQQFGQVNIIKDKSLCEITFELIQSFDENLVKKDVANCLLTGLVIYYKDFKSPKTTYAAFQLSADLIKKGALHHIIINNLSKMTPQEIHFFSSIFQNLHTADSYEGSFAILDSSEFQNFGENEAHFAVEKIKTMGMQNNLLVLWRSHASSPMIKGFFYSKNPTLVHKISVTGGNSDTQSDWVFLQIPGDNINLIKDDVIKLLS